MNVEQADAMDESPVYEAFCDLADQLEQNTRAWGPGFSWLRKQLLCASKSVGANMAEWPARRGSAEGLQLLYQSRRAARETILLLHETFAEGFVTDEGLRLVERYERSMAELDRWIESVEKWTEFQPGLRRDAGAKKSADIVPAGEPCLAIV